MKNKKVICKKINNLINQKQGKRITKKICIEIYDFLRKWIFDGEINKRAGFVIRRMRGCVGLCEGNNKTITITINNSVKDIGYLLDIIAHEMVHQIQYIKNGTMGHGVDFIEYKNKLKRKFKIEL